MSKTLSKSDLVACLSSCCKPREQWRCEVFWLGGKSWSWLS